MKYTVRFRVGHYKYLIRVEAYDTAGAILKTKEWIYQQLQIDEVYPDMESLSPEPYIKDSTRNKLLLVAVELIDEILKQAILLTPKVRAKKELLETLIAEVNRQNGC